MPPKRQLENDAILYFVDAVARLPSLQDVIVVVEGSGDQRRVRVERPTAPSRVWYYEGPEHEERLVREESPMGPWVFYEGPPGEERKVRQEYFLGVTFFDGPRGEERKVYEERPDGSVAWYEGPRGEERVVRISPTPPPSPPRPPHISGGMFE